MKPSFTPGRNIAMKVPSHEFKSTVEFYRDILGFREIPLAGSSPTETVRFAFGDNILWADKVPVLSQAEIWLEVVTDDIEASGEYLQKRGCKIRDGIDPLPDNFKGFWISGPSNIIHLVTGNMPD